MRERERERDRERERERGGGGRIEERGGEIGKRRVKEGIGRDM